MKDFQDLIHHRRSIRKYTDQPLAAEEVEQILKAALLSPSSKSKKPWQFIVVEDKTQLQQLSHCKPLGSKPIAECVLAVVVLADPLTSDVWIEDASIASLMMQLQAEDLNIGSCWIQIRERYGENEASAEQYVRDMFDVPLQMQVLSVITFGYKAQERAPYDDEKLEWEKIHIGKW